MHAIGFDESGQPMPTVDAGNAAVQFCVDRRGMWLQAGEGGSGLHVNGRPVLRMAMLRGGDSIYLDGVEMLLLGTDPLPAPIVDSHARPNDRRTVLRGVGGHYHGHCFSLHERLTVGRSGDCAIRIDEATFAERHARLEPHADGAVLRDLGTGGGSIVNGHPVRDALLRAGDQVVFASNQRFILEAPTRSVAEPLVPPPPDNDPLTNEADSDTRALPASVRRMPWLLLAAMLLAGALSLLLLYGTR